MSLSDRENALIALTIARTGLAAGSVILSEQTGDRPSPPFATLRFGDRISKGEDVRQSEDGPSGAEIVQTAHALKEIPITIEAFTEETTGDQQAAELLTRLQTALRLETVRDTLADAGLTVFDYGTVRNLGDLLGTAFQGRAQLVIRGYVSDAQSDSSTWIETVEASNEIVDPPQTVPFKTT